MKMDLGVLIAYIIGIIILFLLGRMFSVNLKQVLKILFRVLLGGIVVFIINIIGGYAGFKIPLNILSAAIVGFLGLPGIALLAALKLLLNV